MAGHDDAPPARLEPHPADERLALPRIVGPGRAKEMILSGGTVAADEALITRCFASEDGQRGLRSFVDQGPRKATFFGR